MFLSANFGNELYTRPASRPQQFEDIIYSKYDLIKYTFYLYNKSGEGDNIISVMRGKTYLSASEKVQLWGTQTTI